MACSSNIEAGYDGFIDPWPVNWGNCVPRALGQVYITFVGSFGRMKCDDRCQLVQRRV
jgi:hypothetical protein